MGDAKKSYAKVTGYAVSLDTARHWVKKIYTDRTLPSDEGPSHPTHPRSCEEWETLQRKDKFFPHLTQVRAGIETWCVTRVAGNRKLRELGGVPKVDIVSWKFCESDNEALDTCTPKPPPPEPGCEIDVADPESPGKDHYLMFLISVTPSVDAVEGETPGYFSQGDPTDADKVVKDALLLEEILEEKIFFKTWVYEKKPWMA